MATQSSLLKYLDSSVRNKGFSDSSDIVHHSDALIENPPDSDYEKTSLVHQKILKRLKSLIPSSKTHILMWKKWSFPRKTRKKEKLRLIQNQKTKTRTNKKVFNTRNENRWMMIHSAKSFLKFYFFVLNLFFCPT